jgi:hypothetical protein
MKIISCEQNDEVWEKARNGRITSSGMSNIITPTGKKSSSRDKYISRLIAEQIRGEKDGWIGNKHSERGHEFEQEAVDYYSMLYGVEPIKVGFCLYDDELIGASPDRFVGEDGILEVKTCLSEIMIEHYEKESPQDFLEQEHRPQTQSQLFVTGRKWVDTMLYCPLMKPIVVRSVMNLSYLMDMLSWTKEAKTSLETRLENIKNKGFA